MEYKIARVLPYVCINFANHLEVRQKLNRYYYGKKSKKVPYNDISIGRCIAWIHVTSLQITKAG